MVNQFKKILLRFLKDIRTLRLSINSPTILTQAVSSWNNHKLKNFGISLKEIEMKFKK